MAGVANGRACGKVILAGEHAVVYGAPAVAAGIDRGAVATARPAGPAETASTLALGGEVLRAGDAPKRDLARAFAELLSAGPLPVQPVAVEARSELPGGGGLGSSAALGVAIARAVEELPRAGEAHERRAGRAGDDARDARVEARAMAWERVFHGNPSGVDTAAAARGGCLRFTRAEGARPVRLHTELWLCIGSTGTPSATRAMVESVASLRARRPEVVDRSIAAIGALVDGAVRALGEGDLDAVGKLMDLNQMLLAGLMLSTEPIEKLCASARAHGALGAKLTGAGGGGSVIALVASARSGEPDVPDEEAARRAGRIEDAWRAAGFDAFTTRVRSREAP